MCVQVCRLCNICKPLSEFYNHPKTASGVDSKCKDCVKVRARLRHHNLSNNDPDFVVKERKRHSEKYHRLGYKEQQKEWDTNKPWRSSNVYKGLRKKLKIVGTHLELHHWNYNTEYLEDVFLMDIKEHRALHNNLTIDVEKRIFCLEDGEYLDTREKHKAFIEKCGFKILNINKLNGGGLKSPPKLNQKWRKN